MTSAKGGGQPPSFFSSDPPDYSPEVTPVIQSGDYWLKRDDLYCLAGIRGGKVRSCWHLATTGERPKGLVTACSRHSPQGAIVARIAARIGIPARVHVATGALTPEMKVAIDAGAQIVEHRPGYNTVIIARARDDAKALGWRDIPFGMRCDEAVEQTAAQVQNIPTRNRNSLRIVVPVGSGISLAGILRGLDRYRIDRRYISILGITVGANPTKYLDMFAPFGWRTRTMLVSAQQAYQEAAPITELNGIALDPHYEAKCLPFLRPGDLFWLVGIRYSSGGTYGQNSEASSQGHR